MHFGHYLFLVSYVCCVAHAAPVDGTEPPDVPENSVDDTARKLNTPGDTSIDDTARKLDPPGDKSPLIIPEYQDTNPAKGSEHPGDSFISNATEALGVGNASSVDSSGKTLNEGTNKTDELEGISYTERSAGRRLGLSRYKSGRQQVSIGDLTISDHVPRHGALLHKNDKLDTLAVNQDSLADGDKRKRRVQTSSATPSFQIVILVVGAVIGCLLLTGFVRWRVRGRLNAKKNAKMSQDYIYNDERVYKGNTEMTTIYESEFEESQSMLRLTESLDVDMESFFQEEHGTKFGEISNSQRFDMPLSEMSRSYKNKHSVNQPQPRSPKSGRHFRLVSRSKRSMNRHKYGHKNRYSKHLRKRLENMFVQTLDTIPMENTTLVNEYGDSLNGSSLFSELGNKHSSRNVSSERLTATSLQQQPIPVKHGSPTFRRGAFASILNTWRSLSFNRDWVGQMWQEQHNIRRLSDILRGRRESLGSIRSSNKSSDGHSSRLSSSTESISSASSFGSFFQRRGSSLTDRDAPVFDFFTKNTTPGKSSEQNERQFTIIEGCVFEGSNEDEPESNTSTNTVFTTDMLNSAAACPEAPRHDPFISFRSYSDLLGEPAECESLLSQSLQSSNVSAPQFDEHPRYQKIHQRKRVESRKRASSFSGNTPSSDRFSYLGNISSQDDSSKWLRNSSQGQVCSDFDMSDTSTLSTQHQQTDRKNEQNMAPVSVLNESSSGLASSFGSKKWGVDGEHTVGAGTDYTTLPLPTTRVTQHSVTKKAYLA